MNSKLKAVIFLGAGFVISSAGVALSAAGKLDADVAATESMRSELLQAEEKARATGARSPASTSQNVVARKKYPGGADEDDLQVQPALPIPTRTYDGSLIGDEPSAE